MYSNCIIQQKIKIKNIQTVVRVDHIYKIQLSINHIQLSFDFRKLVQIF